MKTKSLLVLPITTSKVEPKRQGRLPSYLIETNGIPKTLRKVVHRHRGRIKKTIISG